jgi:hypothetical protein
MDHSGGCRDGFPGPIETRFLLPVIEKSVDLSICFLQQLTAVAGKDVFQVVIGRQHVTAVFSGTPQAHLSGEH